MYSPHQKYINLINKHIIGKWKQNYFLSRGFALCKGERSQKICNDDKKHFKNWLIPRIPIFTSIEINSFLCVFWIENLWLIVPVTATKTQHMAEYIISRKKENQITSKINNDKIKIKIPKWICQVSETSFLFRPHRRGPVLDEEVPLRGEEAGDADEEPEAQDRQEKRIPGRRRAPLLGRGLSNGGRMRFGVFLNLNEPSPK